MIHIYGDSHARFNYSGIKLPVENHSANSITMHRIGRDKCIVGFSPSHISHDNIFVFQYGEVDCRCHVARQKIAGREVSEVCDTLVKEYIESIVSNITSYKAIIISAVVPPTARYDYESVHGPITHTFPFIGTDEERVSYTNMINEELKAQCDAHGFLFFDPYNHYRRDNGTLVYEYSDGNVHIQKNEYIHERLNELIASIK